MLLRTQISLLLGAAIILIGGLLLAISYAQRQYEAERFTDIAIGLQTSLWDNIVEESSEELDAGASRLAEELASEPSRLTRAGVAAIAAHRREDTMPAGATLQVVSPDGSVIGSTAPLFRARPLIERADLNAFRQGATSRRGLRQESPDSFVIVAMRPVRGEDGNLLAAVSLSVGSIGALNHFSREVGEPAFLLSPRGRLAIGTNPELSEALALTIEGRPTTPRFARVGSTDYFITPMPVRDVSGGIAGTLVALQDVSAAVETSRTVERVGFAVVVVAGMVLIGGLYLVLREAFQPLEGAVAALGALSKGDNTLPVATTGAREIARIGEAISVFRKDAQRLTEQDRAITRQRRRQERIIRRELERLAALLDDDGRAEILADLAEILPDAEASDSPGNAELQTLATLLQRMSQRIADQQHRLTELIAELKASIATRARLAALEQELDIARTLQGSFLPRPLPPHPAVSVSGLMDSAKEVGGDFFDVFFIDEHRLGFAVADVSGKGVPAALFMAITRTLIRAKALSAKGPVETVEEVNDFLAADNEQLMFVTLFHGVLDLRSGEVRFVNAGHNPPYLVDGAGVTALPRASGPALAVVEGARYRQETVSMAEGATLFLFTDGVTEAFSPTGEPYGEARLQTLLATLDGSAPDVTARRVREDVLAFEAGGEQADDVTSFAIRFTRCLAAEGVGAVNAGKVEDLA